jgi:hypothetical protein
MDVDQGSMYDYQINHASRLGRIWEVFSVLRSEPEFDGKLGRTRQRVSCTLRQLVRRGLVSR